MNLMHRVFNYIEQMGAATQMRELGQAFQALAEDYGYSGTIVIDAGKLTRRIGPAILYMTQAKDVVKRPDRLYPLAGHPRFAWARAHDTPIFLDELGRELGIDVQAWRESLPPHLRDQPSLLLPVHRRGRLVWYVGCAGPKPDKSTLAVAILHMAANVARDRSEAIEGGRHSVSTLSRQEAACLRWIGAGKTDTEISAIMGIAPRTVRFHVGNAKKKLGVRTRLQAVAARIHRAGMRE